MKDDQWVDAIEETRNMKHNPDHPYYQKTEAAIRPHLEKYGEPWEKRYQLIQDILNALFREPYNIIDWRERETQNIRDNFDKRSKAAGFTTYMSGINHGVDILGDETD